MKSYVTMYVKYIGGTSSHFIYNINFQLFMPNENKKEEEEKKTET